MTENAALHYAVTRRQLLGAAAVGSLALSKPAWAQQIIDLPLPDGPDARTITTAFPQKGPMIRQLTRLLRAPRARWGVGERRHGQCALDRFSSEGRAG